ncbi:haloacid dehalogenase-like hydrolase [Bacillus sp. V2I10]|uniref:haloacid dehalogenase-like hydrolase n=1 Tax=Bacillus sp. V2I10 TaxID=3042276 RepID=UPI002789AB8D|nr:haloacid dehalogenase-like hydrolase [Bacillus sp. V2I10]MDQ0861851.1 phosphoserine phosphatase [Bacillus sp. V2I10]
MKNRVKGSVMTMILSLLLFSTISTASAGQAMPVKKAENNRHKYVQVLDEGKWAPHTYKAVQSLIDKYGKNNPKYNPKKKPYAVFDWDNTNIMNDTEEALFVYLIDHLAYKLTPEEFSKIIRKDVPPGEFLEDYKNLEGNPVTIEEIAADVDRDYQFLYQELQRGKSLEEVTATDDFKDFKTKLLYMYEAINDTHGANIGWKWILYFFTNMTREELQSLGEASNDANLGRELSKVTLKSPESLKGEAGVVSSSYYTGIRLTPEMSNLMHTLQANGIDVYVVTASLGDLVEVFANNPKYGYNVPKNNILGMRLEMKDGKYEPYYKEDWPFTGMHGKTEVIQKEIASKKRGRGPILVAGDSNGDYEMMTEFSDTELVLIVNRVSGGNIGKLSAIAASQIGEKNPNYVLQGRDENTGLWIPTEYTIKLGTNEKVLLTDVALK